MFFKCFPDFIANLPTKKNKGVSARQRKTSNMEENDFISIWLEESGNPAIEELSRQNEELASVAEALLAAKGLSAHDLALAVDINPDEIHRWLAGRHTFSTGMLDEIAAGLKKLQE